MADTVEYKCYTNQGEWRFQAENDREAMRLALFFCWRDDENFDRLEFNRGGQHYILRISVLDLNSHECWTI